MRLAILLLLLLSAPIRTEAFQEPEAAAELSTSVVCPACEGLKKIGCRKCGSSGNLDHFYGQSGTCDHCRGKGLLPCETCKRKGRVPCEGCEARGRARAACPRCDGDRRAPCGGCASGVHRAWRITGELLLEAERPGRAALYLLAALQRCDAAHEERRDPARPSARELEQLDAAHDERRAEIEELLERTAPAAEGGGGRAADQPPGG